MHLLGDWESHLQAAVAGWDEPWSRTNELLAQLIRTMTEAHYKVPPGWDMPRPWPDPEVKRTAKPAASQAVVRAALKAARAGQIKWSQSEVVA